MQRPIAACLTYTDYNVQTTIIYSVLCHLIVLCTVNFAYVATV